MHQISDIMLNNVLLHGSARGAPHQWAIGHAFVCIQLNIIEFHIAVCQYPAQCILYSNNDAYLGGQRFFLIFGIWERPPPCLNSPMFIEYTFTLKTPLHLLACLRFQIHFFTFVSLILCYEKQNTLGKRLERKKNSWVFEKIASPLHASIPPPATEMPQWSSWHGSCHRCNSSGCFQHIFNNKLTLAEKKEMQMLCKFTELQNCNPRRGAF